MCHQVDNGMSQYHENCGNAHKLKCRFTVENATIKFKQHLFWGGVNSKQHLEPVSGQHDEPFSYISKDCFEHAFRNYLIPHVVCYSFQFLD